MNSFIHFVEYCKKSNEGASLQRFLIIWDAKYPTMIRRSLAMSLKNNLEQLPLRENTIDLQSLLEGMKELNENLKPINKALNHKVKKVTKKEKDDNFLKTFRASQLVR